MKVKEIPIDNYAGGYQVIFTCIEDAIKDAREESRKSGIRLYVIRSRNLFYVDSNGKIEKWEILHAIFENGKLMSPINELVTI